MSENIGKIGGILSVTVLTVLISGFAYAQGPESGRAHPGAPPRTMVAWEDNRGPDVFVGSVIGGFLGAVVESNRYRDRDYYYDRDWDRERDRRCYYRDHRRYEANRWSRHERDYRYNTYPRDRSDDWYGERYPLGHPR